MILGRRLPRLAQRSVADRARCEDRSVNHLEQRLDESCLAGARRAGHVHKGALDHARASDRRRKRSTMTSSNPFHSPDSTASRRHRPIFSPPTSMTTSRPSTAGGIPRRRVSQPLRPARIRSRVCPRSVPQWRSAGIRNIRDTGDGVRVALCPADLDLIEILALDGDPRMKPLPPRRHHSPSSLPMTLLTKPPGASPATSCFTFSRISEAFPFVSAAFMVLE